MRLLNYSFKLFFFLASAIITAQERQLDFLIVDSISGLPIEGVEVYDRNLGLIEISNSDGKVSAYVDNIDVNLTLFYYGYDILEVDTSYLKNGTVLQLNPISQVLTEVEVIARNSKIFSLKRLKDYEGTSINSGKKNEVILISESLANLSTNNARQIFSQVPGLNIFQNDDAGLQLNIGGRGLDPNRTSNFNTRQNGYDISADVLGYPESYYTPPSEALDRIEIIRGAASLQYGTQFGGLVNFVFKNPVKEKKINLKIRNTLGSFNLFTNFSEVSGSSGKFSYYAFYNHKEGQGFRPNSEFESANSYININYDFNSTTNLALELTYLSYLSQQAGGLDDKMFKENPLQSIRSRNWFNVDWLLYNIRLLKKINDRTNFSFQFFGLDASRKALGFRVNRVSQIDSNDQRDLIVGNFNNFGFESKLLREFSFLKKNAVFLFGLKYYKSSNSSHQGPGSTGKDPDFKFYNDLFPYYTNQSKYNYPNTNFSLFGENIFKINDRFSITPGFRFEYINTKSIGSYRQILLDAAFNVISNVSFDENRTNKRIFLLSGIGFSYKYNSSIEIYLNTSQNYRSVTFSDMSTVNPAYAIDPNINDESGFTFDIGTRGNVKNFVNYDISGFVINYDNRIGFIQKELEDGNVKAFRTNTGQAIIYGVEGLADINLRDIFYEKNQYNLNLFSNFSLLSSEYIKSNESGVEGKKVEFVPNINFKAGIKFGFKNFTSYLQYSYISDQYSDSSNAIESNLSGVIGKIPEYNVMDFSMNYKLNKVKLEFGVNNVFDKSYFTRRATAYPGPGIIPSPPRNYYITIQFIN